MRKVLTQTSKFWPTPKSKSVGLFTDFSLYYDALKLCKTIGVISLNVIQRELSQRIIGIRYIAELKKTAFVDLLRELHEFNYIKLRGAHAGIDNDIYEITDEGIQLIIIYENNKTQFLRHLASKMFALYTIPGWLIYRLWSINPKGQGKVIIPAPLKSWNPNSYKKTENAWSDELAKQVKCTFDQINNVCPGSFPVEFNEWLTLTKREYERLGVVSRLSENNKSSESKRNEKQSFAPRRRLATAMRKSSLKLLFNRDYNGSHDFSINAPVLLERSYMAWCPRLETLELLFYSDYYQEIPGRLLFPISIFKLNKLDQDFESNENITAPDRSFLFYHHPRWESFRSQFIKGLVDVYQGIHNKQRIIYVSLQDVRDEVCKKLRISSLLFENFLEEAFTESLLRKIPYSIALETDVREDQRSGSQILRRPVYIQSIPHSLIAININ